MTVKYIIMVIILFLLILFIVQFILSPSMKDKGQCITLKEVLPEAQIISESEGIIEYGGKKFILGQNDFKRKKEIIYKLDLLKLPGHLEIDLRFDRQVIVRKR